MKGYKARFIHSQHTTLAFWEVEQRAVLPIHAHIHEQITQVLAGRFELSIDGKTRVYEPNEVVVIPSNVPHGEVALTDCSLFDVFSPVREDCKNI